MEMHAARHEFTGCWPVLFRLYKQTKFLSINQTLLVVFSESWSHSNEPHNMPLDLVYWVRSDSYDNYMHMYKFKLLHTAKSSDSVELQSWPKCAGHFFPAIVAPPLRSNVGRLFGKSFPFEPNCVGGGWKRQNLAQRTFVSMWETIDGRGIAFCKSVPHKFGQDCSCSASKVLHRFLKLLNHSISSNNLHDIYSQWILSDL